MKNSEQKDESLTSSGNIANAVLPAVIVSKATAADVRLNKIQGYNANDIITYVTKLFETGSVEVGYRAQCGATHKSQKTYNEFCKIIKSLEKLGYRIIQTQIKHKNGYATNNGGFWNSILFELLCHNIDDNYQCKNMCLTRCVEGRKFWSAS